jgi:hypothetical protein
VQGCGEHSWLSLHCRLSIEAGRSSRRSDGGSNANSCQRRPPGDTLVRGWLGLWARAVALRVPMADPFEAGHHPRPAADLTPFPAYKHGQDTAEAIVSRTWLRQFKLFALPRCERCSPVPVCIFVWCRPGPCRTATVAGVDDGRRGGQSIPDLAASASVFHGGPPTNGGSNTRIFRQGCRGSELLSI